MPDLSPYTPALYLPGNYGRYRTYPRHVRTPIPGAGYEATLQWGEQPLNLWGAGHVKPTRYGVYNPAPLLGLGQNAAINRELGYSKSDMKKYWDARAQQCTMFADEGACLARVARHVPVTIGMFGLGSYDGIGQTPSLTVDVGTTAGRTTGATIGLGLLCFGLGWMANNWGAGRRLLSNGRRRRVRRNRRSRR